jgi:hypothetical protein
MCADTKVTTLLFYHEIHSRTLEQLPSSFWYVIRRWALPSKGLLIAYTQLDAAKPSVRRKLLPLLPSTVRPLT